MRSFVGASVLKEQWFGGNVSGFGLAKRTVLRWVHR